MKLERVKGIEPSYSAWKAAALPLSYTRLITPCKQTSFHFTCRAPGPLPKAMVGEVGLEPTKAKPGDLQSPPFATRDTPPIR